MSEEIKFENPTDLLEKVKSHGGKVFETLNYWQSFDPDNNIRILEEVIEYVIKNNHNQKVFEISGEGHTNIPDSADIFTLPRNVKLNAESVSWFFETTLDGLNKELEWNRTLKNEHERAGVSKAYGAVEKEVLERLDELCVDMWERSPAYNQFVRILQEFRSIAKITPWDTLDSPYATNTSSIWCLPFAEYKKLRTLQRELKQFLDSAKQGFDEIIYGTSKVRGTYIKLEQEEEAEDR